MKRFDTKDCEISESSDRKFENFESRDSGFSVPADGVSESSESKDLELEEPKLVKLSCAPKAPRG